jgi:predicted RNA binding protein YcfA (HicA-like mRNA interferase family)
MPKLPRTSGAAIIKALERLGFERIRQTGSHVILRRGPKGCVVPMHSEVKVGTLAGILRQANVSPEEFIDAS